MRIMGMTPDKKFGSPGNGLLHVIPGEAKAYKTWPQVIKMAV